MGQRLKHRLKEEEDSVCALACARTRWRLVWASAMAAESVRRCRLLRMRSSRMARPGSRKRYERNSSVLRFVTAVVVMQWIDYIDRQNASSLMTIGRLV